MTRFAHANPRDPYWTESGDAVELTLPTPSFDALVETLHKARKGTTTVRVDVAALEALIVDHGRLLRAVPHKEPG